MLIPAELEDHIQRFNEAVETGDFAPFVATFADDALMRFEGAPVGPFIGRTAIAEAYAMQPPDDTMRVLSGAYEDDGRISSRFQWTKGGRGTLTLRMRDGEVTELGVAFDP